jgi:hypothetical protein
MTKDKEPKLRLVLYNEKHVTKFYEEIILKEVIDNLILSLTMSMDAIKEVDTNIVFGDNEKRELYIEILDALEYSIDISMGGRDAFIRGMDLKPEEFYFMKGME